MRSYGENIRVMLSIKGVVPMQSKSRSLSDSERAMLIEWLSCTTGFSKEYYQKSSDELLEAEFKDHCIGFMEWERSSKKTRKKDKK